MKTHIQPINMGDFLQEMGIFPDVNAFEYIQDAAEIINECDGSVGVVKLYDLIADRHSATTGNRIERCIRNAVGNIYQNANNPIRDLVLGKFISEYDGKITNGQFLFAFARFCRENHIERHSIKYVTEDYIRQKYIDRLIIEHYPEYMGVLRNAGIK